MAENICANCGNKVPAKAKFCLSCGAQVTQATQPQQAPAPAPVQPRPAPVSRAPAAPIGDIFNTLFTKQLILAFVLLGILLAWIGRIVALFFADAGIAINSIGFAAAGIFLVGGGITNNNLDKYVKLGMVVGGAAVLGLGLGF